MTPEQAAFSLGYDPWGERDATYRTLDDRFVVTRKPAKCAICFEVIPVGSRVRAKREADNGKAMTFRFCVECCRLMAERHDDDQFKRLMQRYDLGCSTADAERAEATTGDA